MKASEIILNARELDSAFEPSRHPEGALLRALARIQRRLIGQLVRVEPQAVTATLEITLPLATFADGAPLEDGLGDPLDITMVHTPLDLWLTGDTQPRRLDLIDWSDRHRVVYQRAAWIRSGTLYLSGNENMWSDATKIAVTYTPTPQSVLIDADLVLPLTAEDALTKKLAAFMASRSKDAELEKPRSAYVQDALDAEQEWFDETRRKIGATVTQTREAW